MHFIRKSILANENQFFYKYIDDYKKKLDNLPSTEPAYISHPEYLPEKDDL